MKNFTKLFLIVLLAGSYVQVDAQSAGMPDGSLVSFFSTNNLGRQLGHRESGTFGNLGGSDQWIGIGQPTISTTSSTKVPAYGMRAQWDGAAGIFALKETGAIKDLSVQWGSNTNSKLRFSFIQDQTNPSALTEVMTLASDGKVGIGNTAPTATLDIFSDVTSGSTTYGIRNDILLSNSAYTGRYGIYNKISGSSYSINGIYNLITNFSTYGTTGSLSSVNGSAAFLYGVYGNVTNTNSTGNTYAIYGRATGGNNVYAGYFVGDVYVSGTLTHASDKKFKKDIKVVSSKDITGNFMKLKPSSYNYKNSESLKFTEGLQYGFVAQEVEAVFPDLVKDVEQAIGPNFDEDGNIIEAETVKFKSVNYVGMIPILTKVVQDHEAKMAGYQAEMDALKAENELLAERFGSLLSAIEAGQMDQIRDLIEANKTSLGQNSPNPFGQETKINYSLGKSVQEANLQIFDANGALVGKYDLEKGKTSLDLSANKLQPGVYIYVMMADGQTIGTRRMVVTQ